MDVMKIKYFAFLSLIIFKFNFIESFILHNTLQVPVEISISRIIGDQTITLSKPLALPANAAIKINTQNIQYFRYLNIEVKFLDNLKINFLTNDYSKQQLASDDLTLKIIQNGPMSIKIVDSSKEIQEEPKVQQEKATQFIVANQTNENYFVEIGFKNNQLIIPLGGFELPTNNYVSIYEILNKSKIFPRPNDIDEKSMKREYLPTISIDIFKNEKDFKAHEKPLTSVQIRGEKYYSDAFYSIISSNNEIKIVENSNLREHIK